MDSVTSVSLIAMPRMPTIHIQNTAPGPPSATASATPPMLPRPTVADSAMDSAWNWFTAPGSLASLYLPRNTAKPWVSARYCENPLQKVNRMPVPSTVNSTESCQRMALAATSQLLIASNITRCLRYFSMMAVTPMPPPVHTDTSTRP